ncbi:class II aldolase/adducin family protein [Rhodopila sp.]|uniref:class II aldolase/adducin family protein n=1 Tax=Rhodopila sp. TaxID=2480087 RepID=UPI003D10EEE0
MRDQVAWLYKAAAARGLIVGSAGNVSARTKPGMLITPSGADPESLAAADLVPVTMQGVAHDQAVPSSARPSSEWAMHAAVYAACPEAAFIVHSHADACTALACLGSPLPAFHYLVVQFGGDQVRCAPYVTFGTQALADHAARAIAGRSACLLANHGMIVCGRSSQHALSQAVLLETLCRQYLLALSAGTPRLLTEPQMRDAQERFKTYGPRQPDPQRPDPRPPDPRQPDPQLLDR